ncbi:hypothetical protein ACOMHN_051677 [Nucella lapillus]
MSLSPSAELSVSFSISRTSSLRRSSRKRLGVGARSLVAGGGGGGGGVVVVAANWRHGRTARHSAIGIKAVRKGEETTKTGTTENNRKQDIGTVFNSDSSSSSSSYWEI